MTVDIKGFREYAKKCIKENKKTIAKYYEHIASNQELRDELEEKVQKGEMTRQGKQEISDEHNNDFWKHLTEEEITEINNHIKRQDNQE